MARIFRRVSFSTSFQLQIKFMLLLLGLRSWVEIIQGAAKILSKLREQKMLVWEELIPCVNTNQRIINLPGARTHTAACNFQSDAKRMKDAKSAKK